MQTQFARTNENSPEPILCDAGHNPMETRIKEEDGAGRRDRTDICSLEGCRSTIELYPLRERTLLPKRRLHVKSYIATTLRFLQGNAIVFFSF